MDTQEYTDKDLAYIYGELSREEESRFEEELKQNPKKAKDLALQKRIVSQVKLEKQLEEIENDPGAEWAEMEAEKAVNEYNRGKRRAYLLSKTFRQKYVYPIAAGLLILLYLGNLTIYLSSPELVFARYCKDYSTVNYKESTINQAQLLFMHSLDAYNKGDYADVAENMRDLMEKGELNIRGVVMLAFYDAWNDPVFQKFKAERTNQEDAAWYLAIAAYKLDELEKAQALFNKVSSENSIRGWRAARMERKIDKMLSAE